MENQELRHWGVLGMRWGVRRKLRKQQQEQAKQAQSQAYNNQQNRNQNQNSNHNNQNNYNQRSPESEKYAQMRREIEQMELERRYRQLKNQKFHDAASLLNSASTVAKSINSIYSVLYGEPLNKAIKRNRGSNNN